MAIMSRNKNSPSRCRVICQTNSIISILMMASFLSTFPSVAMAQEDLTCQEGEVSLKIEISHTLNDGFVNLFVQVEGRRYRLPEDPDNTNGQFNYYSEVTVEDGGGSISNVTSICVPATECLTASVTVFALLSFWGDENPRYDFSPQEFTIEYDGTVVAEPMGPFDYSGDGVWFVTELGNCEVVCDAESEVLLEIEGVTSGSGSQYDWQVLDAVTGESITHCPEPLYYWNSTSASARCYWESSKYYHEKICLPRNGCFALLAGQSYPSAYLSADACSFVVIYDGRQVSLIKNIQFEAISLPVNGASCQSLSCGADEHLLEMFVFRDKIDYGGRPAMTWSLSNAGEREEVSVAGDLGRGVLEDDMRPLQYHRECIPTKGSCARFDLSVPPSYEVPPEDGEFVNNTAPTYIEFGYYRIVIDDVIHGDETYNFGGYGEDNIDPVLELSKYVGDCTASKACNLGESLLVVDMQTGPRSPQWQYYDASWSFFQNTNNGAFWLSQSFAYGVLPDEEYRFLSCYSPDELPYTQEASCTELALSESGVRNGNIADFTVSVDGKSFTEYEECDADYCQGFVIISVGGDCSDPLSSGAIAGIAIAAMAILVGCSAVVYYRYRSISRASSATAATTVTSSLQREEAVAVPVEMAPAAPKPAVTDSANHDNTQQEDDTPVMDNDAEEQA